MDNLDTLSARELDAAVAEEVFGYVWVNRYVDEFTFRLNEGNVERHTLERLDSFVDGVTGIADDIEGVSELQDAVDAFNKANESIKTWDPDYKRKVSIPVPNGGR
jgi:hypothetical protein